MPTMTRSVGVGMFAYEGVVPAFRRLRGASWSLATHAAEPHCRYRPAPLRGAYRAVRMRGPDSVMATVCSTWAAREPSSVRRVQPSGASW